MFLFPVILLSNFEIKTNGMKMSVLDIDQAAHEYDLNIFGHEGKEKII